jgi:hypothetical protein
MRKSSSVFLVLTAAALSPFTAIAPAQAQETVPPTTTGPEGSGYRPTPMALGLGLGYLVNGSIDLMKPTVSSARLVLTDRIVLEPLLILSYQSTSNEVGMATVDTSATTVGFGTQLRYLLASRGPLDLAGIGSGVFTHQSGSNSVGDVHTSVQSFDLAWGVGISWWFHSTWSLSLDATNPILSWDRNSNDNGPAPDQSTSTFFFGVVWNPQLMLMTHLFF